MEITVEEEEMDYKLRNKEEINNREESV